MNSDLSKPYREMLVAQSNAVVRGVLIYTVNGLSKLQFNEQLSKKIKKAADESNPHRIAASAAEIAATGIMIKAAPEIVAGHGTVIADTASNEQLSMAGVVCGLTIYTFTTLADVFIQVGLLPAPDNPILMEALVSIVDNLFPFSTPQQRLTIFNLGERMLKGLSTRPGSDGQRFLDDFSKAILSMAANWDLRKMHENELQNLINHLTHQLLTFR